MAENKESVLNLEEQGKIHIAEDVVASIAALAISEVEGIASLVANSGVVDLISKKSLSRGVKISLEGTSVNIECYILIKYGVSIPQIAQKAQASAKEAIETMTGLEAGTINIHVNGIAFENQTKK